MSSTLTIESIRNLLRNVRSTVTASGDLVAPGHQLDGHFLVVICEYGEAPVVHDMTAATEACGGIQGVIALDNLEKFEVQHLF